MNLLLRIALGLVISSASAAFWGIPSCIQQQPFESEMVEKYKMNLALYSLSPEIVIEHCGTPIQDFTEQLGQMMFRTIRYADHFQHQWEVIFHGPADPALGSLSLLRVGRIPAASSNTLDASIILFSHPCLDEAIDESRFETPG